MYTNLANSINVRSTAKNYIMFGYLTVASAELNVLDTALNRTG